MATQINKDLQLLGGSIALLQMELKRITARVIANPLMFKPLSKKKEWKN